METNRQKMFTLHRQLPEVDCPPSCIVVSCYSWSRECLSMGPVGILKTPDSGRVGGQSRMEHAVLPCCNCATYVLASSFNREAEYDVHSHVSKGGDAFQEARSPCP